MAESSWENAHLDIEPLEYVNLNGAPGGDIALGLPPQPTLSSFSWMPALAGGAFLEESGVRLNAPAPVEAAAGDMHFRRREFVQAWQRYRQAAALNSSNDAYHWKLAMAAWSAGRRDVAEGCLLEAVRIAPNRPDVHASLAQLYVSFGQMDRALLHSRKALSLDPKDIEFAVAHANILFHNGEFTEAWESIRPLVDGGSKAIGVAFLYALLAARLGQEQRAISMVEDALQGRPGLAENHLRFAAASLLDRLGRYDEAFGHAWIANRLTAREFHPIPWARAIDDKIKYFTRRRLGCLPRSSVDGRRIIFIVGMPRSGTTLVEQVLSSHPQVAGGGEMQMLAPALDSVLEISMDAGIDFGVCIDQWSPSDATRLARICMSIAEAAGTSTTYISDKTPLNYLHLGVAQLLFPDCRVIHCTRSPLDTCLSCFFTDFASGNEFAYDLEHLGGAFRQYQRMMGHWKQVLDLPIHEVRYEDLVLDLEGQGRRLLEFLGLPWDERCLMFHENRRLVQTASHEQVRRPIYLSSIGRWRNYTKHLGKLSAALAGDYR